MYLMKRRLHIKVNACKERNRKFKTSFLIERYKEYKNKINRKFNLYYIRGEKDYLDEVDRYNKLGEKEINKLINKNFLEVTYLSITTYI